MFAICDSLFLFPLLDVTSCTPCKPVTAAGHFLAVTRDEKISEGRVHRLQERKRSDSQMEKKILAKQTPTKAHLPNHTLTKTILRYILPPELNFPTIS